MLCRVVDWDVLLSGGKRCLGLPRGISSRKANGRLDERRSERLYHPLEGSLVGSEGGHIRWDRLGEGRVTVRLGLALRLGFGSGLG